MSETTVTPHPDDHRTGNDNASHTLIEYGSYACAPCRSAQKVVSRVLKNFSGDVLYVFRHKPLTSDPWAVPAAVLSEVAARHDRFWQAHEVLMSRAIESEQDLYTAAEACGVEADELAAALEDHELLDGLKEKAEQGTEQGVDTIPTFFVNGILYEGPWDEMSLMEALDSVLAQRIERTAKEFAGWAPLTGVLLAFMSVIALFLANSDLAAAFNDLLNAPVGIELGSFSYAFTTQSFINDFLMAIFFLVVGLEIKREITLGELSDLDAALLPVAGAIGGMVVPAACYLLIVLGSDQGLSGWGVPMATDIAFALGLLAILGRRVPLSLKVFLTTLVIVDDLGAIMVIALFYGHGLEPVYGLIALVVFIVLMGLNRFGVYNIFPYAFLGIALWVSVYASGLHATLAGVLLAIAVPSRPPMNLEGLLAQVRALFKKEEAKNDDLKDVIPSQQTVRALDVIHIRIESPAHRMERLLEPWSSFLILPVFALANAGVLLGGAGVNTISFGIVAGLVIGKPLGIVGGCWLLVKSGRSSLPGSVTWLQLLGAGLLAGVGFTMSIFIANEAFATQQLVDTAKIAVLSASTLAAVSGLALLYFILPRPGSRTQSG